MDDELGRKLFDKALKLLAVRDHSAGELTAKLFRAAKEDPGAAAAVRFAVSECLRLNFVDDGRFARDYANLLAGRGCGAYRIRMNLKNRGIPSELIAEVLAEISNPDDELERAVNAGEFKLRMLVKAEPVQKKREKLFRFLAGRGFRPEAVREALNKLLPR